VTFVGDEEAIFVDRTEGRLANRLIANRLQIVNVLCKPFLDLVRTALARSRLFLGI
jgi:hypothetical protein